MQWCPIVIACLVLFIVVILIEININKDAFTCSPSVPSQTAQVTLPTTNLTPTPATAPLPAVSAPTPAPTPIYTFNLNTNTSVFNSMAIQNTSTSYGLTFAKGNLAIINKDGTTKWDSKTYTAYDCALTMQGDGNLVIYDMYDKANSIPVWAANASPNKSVMMRFDELNGFIELVDTTNSNVLVRVPDYDVQKGMDASGNDITQISNLSIEDLKQKCNAIIGCVAFNSGGYLKTDASKPVANTSVDLYTAKWGVLPPYKNFMNIPVKAGILSGGSKGDSSIATDNGITKLALVGGSFQIIFNNNVMWYTNTTTGDHLDMQGDGNLVLYDVDNKALWGSNTAKYNMPIAIRVDGNRGYIQFINPSGLIVDEYPKSATFATHCSKVSFMSLIPIPSLKDKFSVTAPNKTSFVVDKGNVVCLDKYGDIFFTSTTVDFASSPWHLEMQMDGSLVMYVGTDNKAVWYIDSKGNYNAQAYYNPQNGALELYTWSGVLITRVGGFCAQTGNYDAIQNTDASGYDIIRASGSVDDMKNQCNQLLDCVGFNSNGFLKKNVDNKSPSTGTTLYAKQFITHYPYKKYTDLDSNGNDIKALPNASLDETRRQCDSDPNCAAFNYSATQNIGYMKTTVASSMTPLKGVNLYVKDKDF